MPLYSLGSRTGPRRGLSPAIRDQVITGGARVIPFSNGTFASGTATIDMGNCPIQQITGNGAITITPATFGGSSIIKLTNGASAGAVTFSGFTMKAASTGDALDTTNGHIFWIFMWGDGVHYGYCVLAGQ